MRIRPIFDGIPAKNVFIHRICMVMANPACTVCGTKI